MRKWFHFVLFLFCLESHRLWAEEAGDENSDLNLIPKTVETTKAEPSRVEHSQFSGRSYLKDALTGWINRSLLVQDPTQTPDWQNRTSLDLDGIWQLGEKVRLSLSNRLNAIEGDTITFPSGENIRNDFREGLLSWEIFPRTYLEAGRINIKTGVALGYNPTDFFKSRTTVNIASIDPSALREDRLGSIMVKGQKI